MKPDEFDEDDEEVGRIMVYYDQCDHQGGRHCHWGSQVGVSDPPDFPNDETDAIIETPYLLSSGRRT